MELRRELGVFIGIEINVLSCKLVVADIVGEILEKKIDTAMTKTPQEFVAKVTKYVCDCQAHYKDRKYGVVGVGIALPGNYDDDAGTVEYISNMQNWNGFPLREEFTKQLPDIPFTFQNAGRAGAKGEIFFGSSHPDEQLAYIHGAMGLALSLYSNDGIHVGERGYQARFGHMIIDVGGRQCICGNKGCLEMYASIGSICQALYQGRKVDEKCVRTTIS